MVIAAEHGLGPPTPELAHRADLGLAQSEPFVIEMLPRLPRVGVALDVAAGSGRHSILLAGVGLRVVAVDNSIATLGALVGTAREQKLQISALAADLSSFPLPTAVFDLIVNVNFLDRELVPGLKQALKVGGFLLFDTFLADQAKLGKPRNPAYLLKHWELRELLSGLDLLEYREGLAGRYDARRAWRASALAVRRS
jgi:SAM-dependent methyltransferase